MYFVLNRDEHKMVANSVKILVAYKSFDKWVTFILTGLKKIFISLEGSKISTTLSVFSCTKNILSTFIASKVEFCFISQLSQHSYINHVHSLHKTYFIDWRFSLGCPYLVACDISLRLLDVLHRILWSCVHLGVLIYTVDAINLRGSEWIGVTLKNRLWYYFCMEICHW